MTASLNPYISQFGEEFDAEKSSQYKMTIQCALGGLSFALLDIRNAEVLYKNATNKYTDNFDTLINFCQTAEIPVVQMISKQNLEDSTYYTVYDTIGYVKVMDSLKSKRENFNINELKVVPFSQPQTNFELEAGTKETSGIKVPLFEARTPYEVYLGQPGAAFNEKEWKQRVDNLKAEKESINRYAGLKVGSMEEASTEGNWEKL